MNRRANTRTRSRQKKQINILQTTTRQRHSQKQIMQIAGWSGLVLALIIAVSVTLHFAINFVLKQVLYTNPHYVLNKIEIEPEGHFSPHLIRQAAGLEPGQNLWTLDLRQIAHDLERLPNVSSAKVERHFPDTVTILIHERVPVVKIVGLNVDLGTRETFYLDRDGVVLKPREDEAVPLLPEIIGLTDNEAELEPGTKLQQPSLECAMEILDAIDHTKLHTSIDVRTIDLSNPLYITMVTTRDLSITFQPNCIDQQLVRLQQIFDFADNQARTLRSVDLTVTNVPVTFDE
jgi:cell division protein FtsQ